MIPVNVHPRVISGNHAPPRGNIMAPSILPSVATITAHFVPSIKAARITQTIASDNVAKGGTRTASHRLFTINNETRSADRTIFVFSDI